MTARQAEQPRYIYMLHQERRSTRAVVARTSMHRVATGMIRGAGL